MDSLRQVQGKSIATSVPSFAIRFHPGDEELEEIYPSAEETDDEAEKTEDDTSSARSTSVATYPNELVPCTTTTAVTITGSTSASATTAPSRDPSPMKEYLKGLGKRSTSMDAGIIDVGTFGTSGSDTWRIFHELKGKITKTVEEKFSEMKSDRKSSSSLLSSGPELSRGGRLGAGGKSKDNSSISDSEDISDPSGRNVSEPKIGTLKEDENSPKKLMGDKEEMKYSSSFEEREKDDLFSDSLTDPPSASSAVETSDVVDISSQGFVKKSNFRSKMKHNLSNLRHRHKTGASNIAVTGGVTMSSLSALNKDDDTVLGDSDIEPAVEVSEDTRFALDQPDSLIEPDIPTIDYRTGIPTSHPSFGLRRQRTRRARSIFSTVWSYKYYILGFLCLFVRLLFPVPSSVIGFALGAVCVAIFYNVKDFLRRFLSPARESDIIAPNTVTFVLPDNSVTPILEVPTVKEYEPLTKYAGWMNEYLDEYAPETYTINETQSVYVRLEGAMLRISHTRLKIPKRAMWNERKHKLKFTHQRIYNISYCNIRLLPEGLARKRLWSKKYPICVVLRSFSKYGIQYMKDRDEIVEDEPEPSEVEPSDREPSIHSLGLEVSNTVDGDDKLTTATSPDTKDAETDIFRDDRLNPIENESQIADEEEELSVQDDFSDEDTFCHIDKTAMEETCLYLFARTDREKEDWYRRFLAAAKYQSLIEEDPFTPVPMGPRIYLGTSSNQMAASPTPTSESPPPQQQQQEPSEPSDDVHVTPKDLEDNDIEYLKFMSRFQLQVLTQKGLRLLAEPSSHQHHPTHSNSRDKSRHKEKVDAQIQCAVGKEISNDVMWLNALVGRVLFDVLRNSYWVVKIQERIQKKLSAIKLPYFMEELLVTELELGNTVPMVHHASRPMLDQRGLWVDLDVTYEGMICLTLETKLNLMKLKKVGEEQAAMASATKDGLSPTERSDSLLRGSPMFNSDVDDSAESSDDDSDINKSTSEEESAASSSGAAAGGGTGKKLLRMVNKIAASKYFQHAAEYKYIKRAMEEVSNTRIMLSVELKGLVGTLALNFPPHPSDRLWYGFRGNPRLWLSARPKLGERRVNIGHVISWIEKKLIQEFQKKFVLPNMDDLVIPPMTTNVPD